MRPGPAWPHPLLEAAVAVVLFGLLARWFCAAYFPLDDGRAGGPSDFVANSALGWIVAKTLQEHGQLPLWNPYFFTGLPLIGTPYISFFNPFSVLPLLLLGPLNGPKVATVIAVALAGIGQYWLSRVLGQGRAVSFVAGVLGLSAGALVGRVASGMSYEQGMQHAWMAATLASYILALRTRRPVTIAGAALCYALLFHAGNLYYWVGLSAVLGLFTIGYSLTWDSRAARPLRLDPRPVLAGGAVAGLAFLLVAVQALPMVDLSRGVEKPTDAVIQASQPPLPTLFDFVVADRRFWAGGLFDASDLGWGVHYAYLGAGLFLFLLFLVPAFRRRPGRDLPLLALATVLTVALAAAKYTVVLELWRRSDVLRQLRFWGEMTAVTTVVLIPLALAGADYLWRGLAGAPRWSFGVLRPLLWAGLAVLLWRVATDPLTTNRPLWQAPPYDRQADDLLAWLRRNDPSPFFTDNNDNVIPGYANVPLVRYDLQILNSSWVLKPKVAATAGAPDGGRFIPTPKYVLSGRERGPRPGTTPIYSAPGGVISAAPPGLPFAFLADPQRLPYGAVAGAQAVESGQVTAADARFDGPNQIVLRVPAGAPAPHTTLVVLQTWHPGWRARAENGADVAVRPAGGFVALDGVLPGRTYVLRFRPASFVAGAWLSLLGLAGVAALLALELRRLRRPLLRPFVPADGHSGEYNSPS